MSVHQKKNGTWYARYRVPGEKEPINDYTGVGPEGEQKARALDKQIKDAKASGKKLVSNKMYLDELAQAYLTERKMSGASPEWLKEMERLFNKKFLPHLCKCPVDDLKYPDIVKMAAVCFDSVKLATRQRYLGYLRAAFNYGTKYELTTKNPLSQWEKQPEPRYDYRLTLEGLQSLIVHAAPHLAWAIAVEWEVAARPGPSELYALQWSHVDYNNCRIRIPGTKTFHSDRLIPISEVFRDVLKKRQALALSEYIIEYKGQGVKTLKTAFKGAQRRAKLPYKVRMYDIRHLFVTVLLDGGAALAAVSRLIGHSAVSTTQTWYYQFLPGGMDHAITLKPALEVMSAEGQN